MASMIVPAGPDVLPNRPDDSAALEEDARLRHDIRLLGRILGDTVREQEGEAVFDLVEGIRQTSIRFHNHIGYHEFEGPAVDLDEREVALVDDEQLAELPVERTPGRPDKDERGVRPGIGLEVRPGDGGLAEQRLQLGVEVAVRVDAVARAQLEHLLAQRRVEREDHRRLARVVAHEPAQLGRGKKGKIGSGHGNRSIEAHKTLPRRTRRNAPRRNPPAHE